VRAGRDAGGDRVGAPGGGEGGERPVNKGAIRPRSVVVMALFAFSCFGLLLFLWLSFGGPVPLKAQGYRVSASFSEATTLATEADVRISGVPVGKVKKITADRDSGLSLVVIEIQSRYAPLPSDVRAILRQKTLLGETYVELTPGSKSAPPIPEDGHLRDGAVAQSVQLDEIFRSFDPKTRAAFQTWMQEQSKAIGPYARDVNAALGNLAPFAEDTADLVATLHRQDGALRRLVSGSADVFEALTERDGQLRGLTRNLAAVFRTTGQRDRELEAAFVALPTFQREARQTLQRLDRFADDTDPLVTQLRPAARELGPTLQEADALAPDLRDLFRSLNPLISASREGFPAAEQLLRELEPFLQQVHPAMDQLIPILQFLAPYKREITSFLANSTAATQARSAVGSARVHYLRTANPLHPQLLAAYPRRIGSNRPNPYTLPGAYAPLTALPEFETRQCDRGDPLIILGDPAVELFGQQATDTINRLLQPPARGAQVAAPPCNQQRDFDFQGKQTRFPRVGPRGG
jgi:virulence factor Mce-like protein